MAANYEMLYGKPYRKRFNHCAQVNTIVMERPILNVVTTVYK